MASIRERTTSTAGTTYSVLYRHGGKQRSHPFTTRKAAENFRDLVNLIGPAKALATYEVQAQDGLTVDQLAEQFFEWKQGQVTARTIADYRRDYANWIKPTFGHRYADTVDELDVQQWVDKIKDRLDPKSVKDRHMILGSLYRYGSARSRRLVQHNPCLETQLPKRRKKPAKGATLPEWLALYDAAQRVDPDAADLLLLIVATGWRFSEATPLTVAGVEDHGEQVFVSVRRVVRRGEGQAFAVAEDEAKSFAGLRRVRVGRLCAAMLRRRVVGKGPDDLVLTNKHGRQWNQTNFLNRTWTDILAEAKIERRFTPHALRHMHVALLDRSGASMAEAKRRLGHEDIATTYNTYGGMIDQISDQTLDAMDLLIEGRAEIPAGEVVRGELG